MKAVVMSQPDGRPQYADFPDPVIKNDNEVLLNVKAAAIKHIDRSTASGQHYSAQTGSARQASVIGGRWRRHTSRRNTGICSRQGHGCPAGGCRQRSNGQRTDQPG